MTGTVIAVGVAASRLYLGYHWLTDVMASALVATGWLGVVWLLADASPKQSSPLLRTPAADRPEQVALEERSFVQP